MHDAGTKCDEIQIEHFLDASGHRLAYLGAGFQVRFAGIGALKRVDDISI